MANFKVIIALKLDPLPQQNLYCTIQVQGKNKNIDLPQSQGQFFELDQLPNNILISFYSQQKLLGKETVDLPKKINQEETEINNTISFQHYKLKQLFLKNNKSQINKSISDSQFFQKQKNYSPSNKKYLKSQNEHEESHQKQSKDQKMLCDVKSTPSLNKSPKSDRNKNFSESEHMNSILSQIQQDLSQGILIDQLKNCLQQSDQERDTLQKVFQDQVKQIKELNEETQKYYTDFEKEKRKLINEKQKTEETAMLIQNQNDDLKLDLTQKSNEIESLKQKIILLEEFSKLCKDQQNKLEVQEKAIKDLTTLKQLTKKQKQKDSSTEMKEEIQNLKTLLSKEQQNHQSTKQNLKQIQEQLQQAQAKLAGFNRVNAMNERLQEYLESQKEQNQGLEQKIQHLQKKMQEMNIPNDDENLKIKINNLQRQIYDQNNQIQSKNNEIINLRLQLTDLQESEKNIQLEENHQISIKGLGEANMKVQELLNEITDQLKLCNKQLGEARLYVHELEQEVSDKDIHLKNMKKWILSMKERQRKVLYIPEESDHTDAALGEFLNTQDDWIKNLFLRQSEGVYQYGSKKLYVKVEQGKIKIRQIRKILLISLIRSGGGFMNIEDFLQLHSQSEMEKAYRSDPLSKISKNIALYKKIDEMKSVRQIKKETYSPIKKNKN